MIESVFLGLVKTISPKANLVRHVSGVGFPYVVVSKVSSPRGETLDGMDGTVVSRFQVDVYGKTYASVKNLAVSLYGVCDLVGSNISHIHILNDIDSYEADGELYRTTIDFRVSHYE